MAQKYDIVWAVNEVCKSGYNFGVFVLNAFFKVSSLESLKQSYDAFAISKFSQTIEEFQNEHDSLDKEQLLNFYEDLKYNEQNLNYLYKMFKEAFNSTYRLHMKILARLSIKLIRNNTLNRYEASLLANLPSLTDYDFIFFYELIKGTFVKGLGREIEFNQATDYESSAVARFISMGLLSRGQSVSLHYSSVSFSINDYSIELYKMLDEFRRDNNTF